MEESDRERNPLLQINRTETLNSPFRAALKRYGGIGLAGLAAVFYSFSNLILKTFDNYHPFTLAVWRFQGMVFPSALLVAIYACIPTTKFGVGPGMHTWTEIFLILSLILVRSLFGCTSTILQIYALNYLTLADASAIIYSYPIVVTFFAHCCIGEKATWVSLLYAVITFAGVLIISRPPFLTGRLAMDWKTVEGVLYAVVAMILGAVTLITLRLMKFIHYSLAILSYAICSAIESFILAAIQGVIGLPHGSHEWSLATCLFLFTFLGQAFSTLALHFEKAGPVSLILSTDVVFSFILQLIFLGVVPDKFSLIGSAIVMLGVSLPNIRMCWRDRNNNVEVVVVRRR